MIVEKTEKKWFFVMTLSLCLSQQIAISSLTAQHFGVMSGNPRYAIDYLIKCLPSTKKPTIRGGGAERTINLRNV